jgi:hypothetical protein
MPSCLPGFVSGGAPIVSGNPFSGYFDRPPTGIRFKLSRAVSGLVYLGVNRLMASGGITSTSGGALSSGGINDGWELGPGDETFLPAGLLQGSGGLVNRVYVHVPAAISGTMRVFWRPE